MTKNGLLPVMWHEANTTTVSLKFQTSSLKEQKFEPGKVQDAEDPTTNNLKISNFLIKTLDANAVYKLHTYLSCC